MKRTADNYRDCAAAGMSKSEASRALGVSVQCVDDMAWRHNIVFRDGRRAVDEIWQARHGCPSDAVGRSLGRVPTFSGGNVAEGPASPLGVILGALTNG